MSDPRLLELSQLPLHQRAARIVELFNEGLADQPAPRRAERRATRRASLSEKPLRRFRRGVQALSHWLTPARLGLLSAALGRLAADALCGDIRRNPSRALAAPDGFCGRAPSLAAKDLIDSFARGMAPRAFLGMTVLVSPAQRLMLRPWNFPRGVGEGRSEAERVSLDVCFDRALALCAERADFMHAPRTDLALGDLYDDGFAHSLEVWDRNDRLIGALVGVASGGVFCIERVWAEDEEALARGVNNLAFQLQRWNFSALDFTAAPELAARLGCGRISRAAYLAELANAACSGRHGGWRIDADLRRPARAAAPAALKILTRAQSAA